MGLKERHSEQRSRAVFCSIGHAIGAHSGSHQAWPVDDQQLEDLGSAHHWLTMSTQQSQETNAPIPGSMKSGSQVDDALLLPRHLQPAGTPVAPVVTLSLAHSC